MSAPQPGPSLGFGETWPSLDAFEVLAQDRRVIPVVRRLLADGVTAVGLFQALCGDRAGTFLLESAEHGRAWSRWCVMWMEEARRCATADGRLAAFIDWRQLPAMTDAVQAAGWIWRGIVPWNKGEGSRPNPGGFRSQCEFIVWASTGPLPAPVPGVLILPGCFSAAVKQDDKHHQTGKPTSLMRDLVKLCPPGGVIFDGYAGSGTTAAAALMEGRRVIAVERSEEYYRVALERCRAAAEGHQAVARHRDEAVARDHIFELLPRKRVMVFANAKETAERHDGIFNLTTMLVDHEVQDLADLFAVRAVNGGALNHIRRNE